MIAFKAVQIERGRRDALNLRSLWCGEEFGVAWLPSDGAIPIFVILVLLLGRVLVRGFKRQSGSPNAAAV